MLIHLHSASQQRLVVALTTLSTIEIHMVPYKYTREAFLHLQSGESPKWNISCNKGTCDLPEIYVLTLGLRPRACAYILGKSLICPCYNYNLQFMSLSNTTRYILKCGSIT